MLAEKGAGPLRRHGRRAHSQQGRAGGCKAPPFAGKHRRTGTARGRQGKPPSASCTRHLDAIRPPWQPSGPPWGFFSSSSWYSEARNNAAPRRLPSVGFCLPHSKHALSLACLCLHPAERPPRTDFSPTDLLPKCRRRGKCRQGRGRRTRWVLEQKQGRRHSRGPVFLCAAHGCCFLFTQNQLCQLHGLSILPSLYTRILPEAISSMRITSSPL